MILVRLILICIIIYLLVRSVTRLFYSLGNQRRDPEPEQKRNNTRGVPKEVGEYVDYEEVE
jgi:hypothetical protein